MNKKDKELKPRSGEIIREKLIEEARKRRSKSEKDVLEVIRENTTSTYTERK